MHSFFRKFSEQTSALVGSAWAFFIAVVIVVIWGASGPFFGFSNTWQLVINTGTTIVTFLMVFLIQNTQNRDSRAVHLKLDELLRANDAARTALVDLETLTDDELERLHEEFHRLHRLAERSKASRLRGVSDSLHTVSHDVDNEEASRDLHEASENVEDASEKLERETVPAGNGK